MEDIGKVLYEKVKANFDRRCKDHYLIKTISKRIANGKADMIDLSSYAGSLGAQLANAILDEVTQDLLPDGRLYYNIAKSIIEPMLKGNYDLINSVADELQASLDRKLSYRIKAQHAPFPQERVNTAIGAASQEGIDWETVRRRMSSTPENITHAMADDYMKANAEFRSKAGIDTYIERKDDGKCCEWCSGLAGRYRYPEQVPRDVFRRHDNCGCLVSYVTPGGMRQNVHTKKWANEQAKAKRIEYAASVEKPVKLSENEAKELEKGLLEAKRGKDDNAIANLEYINSQAFADKFKGKYENEQVEQAVVSACRKIVKNRNGTFFEEAYFIDAQTGRTISYVKGKQKYGIEMPEKLKKLLTNANEKSIIMIHNHPNSSPLSRADYLTSSNYKSCYEALAVGHNGDVFSFKDTFETQGSFLGYFVENGKKYPYYEAIRDYKIAYTKYTLRGQDDFQARNMAWEDVSRMRGFTYEKK